MITQFKNYIKEAVDTIKMERSISDIDDELMYYDAIFDYLRKEMIGKTVKVERVFNYRDKMQYVYNDIDINVDDVKMENYTFHFIDKNGSDFIIPDYAKMTWYKLIDRVVSDQDPYGEEDWNEKQVDGDEAYMLDLESAMRILGSDFDWETWSLFHEELEKDAN